MTIESLVHSNPTSPILAHSGNQASATERRRRRLKKPSIDVYFTQTSSSSSSKRESGGWSGKRLREDDVGRTESAKRMYAS